jgi:UDP-N-acetylglucosamine:LPS N-acetylglucosamine transferase
MHASSQVRDPSPIPAPRALIVTADIGAGHDLPARQLADALREGDPPVEVVVADGLRAMGRVVHGITRRGAETVLERTPWLFAIQYWLVQTCLPTRRLTGWLGMRLGADALLRLVERTGAAVVISTYPGTTEILGRLRREGRLAVPIVAAITDLAALRYWAHPGVDLHLITHAQSRTEVAAIAGAGADIRHVRGLTRPEYDAPPPRGQARAALGLPATGPVVVVSGGGWGIGDLERATRTVLAIPDATAVCLCGTNTALRARIEAAFAAEARVRAEAFTARMADWLAAADVLVHSTAGLTVLEAEMCGTWAISYGWGVGHIRINNRAYRRFGLAAVAATDAELAAALRAALAAARPRDPGFARLPAAADAIREVMARGASQPPTG